MTKNPVVSLFDHTMADEICLLKNGTRQKLRMKMWNKSYITETKGEAFYPEPEEERIIEAGRFLSIDATEMDKLWMLKQRLCQIDVNFRVYIGNSVDHSDTLEVAEFLSYGGIIFTTAAGNDELQKRFVLREQLVSRGSAAAGCRLVRFLSCLDTKQQRIREIEDEINSILDGSVGSRTADSCVDKDVGVNQDTSLMTTGTSEDKHKGWSANLMQTLLQKKGTNCHLSCKEPPERLPLHIGVTENQFASGVKLNYQIQQKRATNSFCMLGAKKQCIKEMEEEHSFIGDGSTSTANHNGEHCDISGSEVNPPITTTICDVAVEEKN